MQVVELHENRRLAKVTMDWRNQILFESIMYHITRTDGADRKY